MTLFKLQYKGLNNRIISGFDLETKGWTNILNSKTVTYNFCSQMNPKTRPENVMAYFILIPFDCCLVFCSQLNLALVTYYLPKPWRGGKYFLIQASGIPKQSLIRKLVFATTWSFAKRRNVYSESNFPRIFNSVWKIKACLNFLKILIIPPCLPKN